MHLPLVQQAPDDPSNGLRKEELLLQNRAVTFDEDRGPILLGEKDRSRAVIRADLCTEIKQERHRFFFRKREVPAHSLGPVTRRPTWGRKSLLCDEVHGDTHAAQPS